MHVQRLSIRAAGLGTLRAFPPPRNSGGELTKGRTAITAYRDWRAVGGGVEEEAATIGSRTRFLAIMGMGISVFSSLVVIAQWAAIVVFAPCMRV